MSVQIPSCSASGGLDERCQFGTTPDGAFLCVGNSKGEVYVYETSTGTRLAHESAIKVVRLVHAPSVYSSWESEVIADSSHMQTLDTARVSGSQSGWRMLCVQVSGPVRACGLSEDCRHLLAAMGNGFIFRFEYCRPAEKEASDVKDVLGDAMEE